MKILRFVTILAAAGLVAAPALSQARTNTLTATMSIIGKGITGVGPTSCSVVGGTGSAGAAVCQMTATTVPAGQPVVWAITGGPDAAKFAMTTAGALSVGSADIPVSATPLLITVTATAAP